MSAFGTSVGSESPLASDTLELKMRGSAVGTLDSLFKIYLTSGNQDYIGEPVSQLEHMQQAAWLARRAGASDALVLGAFFHDIGHLAAPDDAPRMDALGVLEHERVGADLLRDSGLGGAVADLVELHVQAKRYLCFARPAYAAALSEASRGTLAFQGGPMTGPEAAAFESHPCFADTLKLRAWDEAAKEKGGQGLSLDTLRELAETYRREHGSH